MRSTRVDLAVARGATLGLVGESGCGKSVTSLAIMGLLPKQSAEVTGSIRFDGFDLLDVSDQIMRDLRGNRLAMIFQEPMTSLNPSFTIGDQIIESILRHRGGSKAAARKRTIELLRRVHIPSPEQRVDEYPHKLSGGMRQRVMIAMALACDPRLLIADEPTTALDVTLQAQILDLMRELKAESGAAIILITHDLGVVAEVCDEVAVMYAGEIVERASVDALFASPQHPYTVGLLGSIPRLDHRTSHLATIEGMVPNMADPPTAAASPRAALSPSDACLAEPPPLVAGQPRPLVALHPGAAGKAGVVMTALLGGEKSRQAFRRERSVFGRPIAFVKAVDGVSFSVDAGETLALVGESGCGKSTVSRLVLRLIEPIRAASFRRPRSPGLRRERIARLPPRCPDHLPGPLRLAQSAHDRQPDPGRAAGAARPRAARRRRERVEELLRLVGLEPRFGAPLSARIFRRPAPAHRDRARARGRAEAHHLRRAGVGARRLDPLADPQPAARPAATGWV